MQSIFVRPCICLSLSATSTGCTRMILVSFEHPLHKIRVRTFILCATTRITHLNIISTSRFYSVTTCTVLFLSGSAFSCGMTWHRANSTRYIMWNGGPWFTVGDHYGCSGGGPHTGILLRNPVWLYEPNCVQWSNVCVYTTYPHIHQWA